MPDPFSDEDKAWLTEFFRETMERIDPEYVSRLEDRSKYAEDTAHEFSFLGFFNYEEATKFAAALVADVAFLDTLIDTSRRGGKVNEHQLATLLALIEPATVERFVDKLTNIERRRVASAEDSQNATGIFPYAHRETPKD